jgi:hypothetical protein
MPVLAHQGGWDEVAYVAIPAVLVLLWVRWAEKRARARRAAERDVEGDAEPRDDGEPG